MAIVPLGVCVLPEPGKNGARTVSYPNYVFEILAHAGIFHTKLAEKELEAALGELKVLVTVGEADFPPPLRKKLADWIDGGGAWLSVGGLCGMGEVLGATRLSSTFKNWGGGVRSLGEGYLVAEKSDHRMLPHINRPLHYFGGIAVEAKGATVVADAHDAHGRPAGEPALLEHTVGKGRAVLIAPDLTGTIVYVQQGRGGVTRDGVPAPDGTSPVNDSVLKSDDGAILDWLLDREPVQGADGLSIFIQPVADLWREILIRGILYLAQATGASLPVLWYWPRKLPAVGHLSHDTDGNDPKLMPILLDTLAAGEVKSTWCVILPGYPPELMAKIKSAGHEFATHYDSMSPGLPWSAEQFDRQFRELKQMFGGEQPTTNKNHYLRWENDTDIWDWCLKHGIQLDQSKGASKTGEAGFNFGTCHPFFPVRFDGSSIDVLELATPTQDLVVFAPEAIFEPLLAQAKKHHGVLHLLFHPAHFNNPAVPKAMSTAIRRGKEEGLEWWTARQINAWERARRKVLLKQFQGDSVTLECEQDLSDATVLTLSARSNDGSFSAWGFSFHSRIATLKPGSPQRIDVE
jgi:peptidoglycan/xylan/chitin deacetylase (PgdA/CDA1 family)